MIFLWGLTVGYIAGCLITKSVWNRDVKKKKEILIKSIEKIEQRIGKGKELADDIRKQAEELRGK